MTEESTQQENDSADTLPSPDFDEAFDASLEAREITGGADESEPSENDPAEVDEAQESKEAGNNILDDTVVKLEAGNEVSLKELKQAYIRNQDYMRQSTEFTNRQKSVENVAKNVSAIFDQFVAHLSEKIPPKPEPSLAYSDPTDYVRKEALHKAAIAEVEQIIGLSEKAKEGNRLLSHEQFSDVLAQENAKLVTALPKLADEKQRGEFNQRVYKTAQDLGFSADELNSVVDHRILVTLHYAEIGRRASQQKMIRKSAVSTPNLAPGAKRPNIDVFNKALSGFKQTRSVEAAHKALDAVDWS